MKKAVSFTAFFLALLSFGGIGAACGKAGKTDYPKIDTTSYNEQSIKNFAEYKALGIGAPLSAVKSGKVAAAKAYAEEESVAPDVSVPKLVGIKENGLAEAVEFIDDKGETTEQKLNVSVFSARKNFSFVGYSISESPADIFDITSYPFIQSCSYISEYGWFGGNEYSSRSYVLDNRTGKIFDMLNIMREVISDEDKKVLSEVMLYPEKIGASIEKYRFREALGELMNLARLGNKYLADNEPWKLQKTDPARTEAVMYTALQIAGALAVLSGPFLPFASEKLARMLDIKVSGWDTVSEGGEIVPSGHRIGQAELLFEKIENAAVEAQLKKLNDAKLANIAAQKAAQPQKDAVLYDDFDKMDIRVGVVTEAEKVPKAKKLLRLTIDTGLDKRTVVSGIAESFSPEQVVGRRVCVLVNLAPREIKGITSNGMILMTEYPDGRLEFVSPAGDVPAGSKIS